jgi:hypothetical protein
MRGQFFNTWNKQKNKNNQFSSSRQRQLSSFVIVINKECIHFVDKQTNRCIKTIVRTHFSPWSYVDHAKWFNSLYYLKKRLVRCYSLDGLNFFDKAVRTIFILSHHKDFYSLFLKCFWTFSVFFFVSVCLFISFPEFKTDGKSVTDYFLEFLNSGMNGTELFVKYLITIEIKCSYFHVFLNSRTQTFRVKKKKKEIISRME